MISLATEPLLVLRSQQLPCDNATYEQEHCEVGQNCAMAGIVPWFVTVDVGRDDAVEIAEPDHDAHGHAALVDAFDVVGCPDYGVSHARKGFMLANEARDPCLCCWVGDLPGVDAHRCEVHSDILDGIVLAADKHAEAKDAEQTDADIAEPTLTTSVCQPADENCADCGASIWGDGK